MDENDNTHATIIYTDGTNTVLQQTHCEGHFHTLKVLTCGSPVVYQINYTREGYVQSLEWKTAAGVVKNILLGGNAYFGYEWVQLP